MYVRCFLKFCRIYHLIPHVFNIEALQEFLYTTIVMLKFVFNFKYFSRPRQNKNSSSTKNAHLLRNMKEISLTQQVNVKDFKTSL